jgi:phosphoribosylformylglycinamidine synthase
MKAAICVFPGTNRERDMAQALRIATGHAPAMLWHRESALPPGLDLVVLPGGFSYGDYLRCGAMAAQSPVMAAVRDFAARGGHVLGVCNGFQMLVEAELLPGALLRNASLRFLAMDCTLRVEQSDTPFTRGFEQGQEFRCTLAHGDGNYFCDDETLAALEGERRVVLRYAGANPNGSRAAIAGICSPNRRVLGLMPHPENAVDAEAGGTEGLPMFTGLADHFARA